MLRRPQDGGRQGDPSRLVRVEHAFGRSAPFAVGAEEELLLVEAAQPHRLDHRASAFIARVGSPQVKPDVYEAMVEGASSICADAPAVAGELGRLRGALRQAAATLSESSFRAGRYGLAATIWWQGALRPSTEVATAALALARPYARDLGGDDALEEIERVLRDGNGADRMRAAHAAGGMPAVPPPAGGGGPGAPLRGQPPT